MPQLRGVDRNHTASLVLVARFVERPALGIRLVTNEPADGENHIAVVAEDAAKLGLKFAALSGLRDDRAAFASVDEDAESELVGVVTARLCDDMRTNLCTAGNLLAFRLGASSRDRARRCSGLVETSSSVHIRLSCEEDAHLSTAKRTEPFIDLPLSRPLPTLLCKHAQHQHAKLRRQTALSCMAKNCRDSRHPVRRMVLVLVLACGTLEVVRCAPSALEPSDLKARFFFSDGTVKRRQGRTAADGRHGCHTRE